MKNLLWIAGIGAAAYFLFFKKSLSTIQDQLRESIANAIGFHREHVSVNITKTGVTAVDNRSGSVVVKTAKTPAELLALVKAGGLNKYWRDPFNEARSLHKIPWVTGAIKV